MEKKPSQPHKKKRSQGSTATVDPEIKQIFKRIATMQDSLKKKLFVIYKKSGIAPDEIRSYLDNPDNIPPSQWNKIATATEQLEEKVTGLKGKALKKKKKDKEQKKLTKKRKGKTLGGRKGWIQM